MYSHCRSDEFHWLRASNWQNLMQDPENLDGDIRAYLEAENQYAKKMLADTDDLQTELIVELRGRIKEDDMDVPEQDGPWAYYWRYLSGSEYSYFARIPLVEPVPTRDLISPDALQTEMVLRDGVVEAEDLEYFELGDWQDLLPHNPGHLIHGVDACEGWLVWIETRNALPLICLQREDGVVTEIHFDEEAYELDVSVSPDYTTRADDAREIGFMLKVVGLAQVASS